MHKISVVIPCFKSETIIDLTVGEVVKALDALDGYDYEIILVSDASPDDVYGRISEMSKNNPKITGLEFSRNFGQHAALLAGYRETSGDFIVSMDDDGVVSVKLVGACGNCPGAAMTLRNGVEARLKEEIPEVNSVVRAE